APRSKSLSTLSVPAGTRRRSPEVSLAAFRAQPPDLRSAPLMDMGFTVSCPLAQRSRLLIRFLFIGSRFRSALLSGLASRRMPLRFATPFTSIRLGRGLSPLNCETCSAHNGRGGCLSASPPPLSPTAARSRRRGPGGAPAPPPPP